MIATAPLPTDTPLTVAEVARHLRAQPRDVSMVLYGRYFHDSRAPVSNGKRMIDPALVPEIERELIRRGRLAPMPNQTAQEA